MRFERQLRQPAWLLWSLLPALLLIIAFGLWVRLEALGPTPVDRTWLGIVGLDQETVPYWIAVVLAEVGGGTGAVTCTGVLAVIFALRRRFRAAAFLVSAMGAGIITSGLLKIVVTRLRPVEQLYESTGFSYPSGHSMGAAALATSLAIIAARAHGRRGRTEHAADTDAEADFSADPLPAPAPTSAPAPRLRFHWSFVLAAIWILTMMWSRTALQVHWLTDTIAGALVGVGVAVLVDEIWSLTAERTRSPRFALWL
ncbi:phosphatase PAP2 family protein [Brevibacterium renqingii]|uniref:phosphatase PAP2 family protein n=1 Tax=Brevibacterium renqingii TaxID=2776916 RepID=UPI001ADF7E97|nr:phosphatase PAP2 family protein [Brevibacterium renqingii]